MNHLRLQHNRELLAGKTLIGIDPAKDKNQAAVVDADKLRAVQRPVSLIGRLDRTHPHGFPS
jgi:hypothetical protein